MEFLQFTIIGLGLGSLYALASQGLMVVYRGSGVINFAQGAFGMVAAYLNWELQSKLGLPAPVALVGAIGAAAALGAGTHLLIMRPLRHAAPLARVAATLGILIFLEAIAILRYGSRVTFVPQELPTTTLRVAGLTIPMDRLLLVVIAVVLTGALWAFYRYTRFGLATTAVAENPRSAATLGISPDLIATVNWAIGSALAGAAAILVAPIVTLKVTTMTGLVLAALAAALVAQFRSFPIALLAGLVLGVIQTQLTRVDDLTGLAQSSPFLVIVVVLLLRGRSLPARGERTGRQPAVGDGRIPWRLVGAAAVVCAMVIALVPGAWQSAFVTTFAVAVVLLSLVVLVGYTGQLSLAQIALAGFGAWVAGRLVAVLHLPFLPALIVGALATVPIGVLFALLAARARGIQLAIVTFGLGAAMELMLFNNSTLVGGFSGTAVEDPTLFGLDLSAIAHPERYAWFCLIVLLALTALVANLRRGAAGRQLLAVRTNERAAAAMGINVAAVKVYSFAIAAGIAGTGGVLLAFQKQVINYATEFPATASINAAAWAVIGGIGFLAGPLIGATLAPGSVGAQLINTVLSDDYVRVVSGILLVLLVLGNQDGSAREAGKLAAVLRRRFPAVRRIIDPPADPPIDVSPEPGAGPGAQDHVEPADLSVQDLSVRYGGVQAVDCVSLQVHPGRITGLIGPNGAGKTSVIDAITGFAPATGTVRIGDVDVSTWSAARRSRRGLSRSFQSLELFDDITVAENLRAACDPRDLAPLARDVLRPARAALPAHVMATVREFGLDAVLSSKAEDLSYGQRRLLAIARAVANRPSVLLLDEPAAGLGSVETRELARAVRRLADQWQIGILLVEHDMNFVMSVSDQVVVLNFGATLATGTPEQVRADPAVIGAYLGEDDIDESTEAAPASPTSGREGR